MRERIDKLGREGGVVKTKSLAELGLNYFVLLDPACYAL